jgi:uncharacterized Tic20 family protein
MGYQKQCPACGSSNSADSPICTCCAHMFNGASYGQAAGNAHGYASGPQQYATYSPYATTSRATPDDRHLATVMWISALFLPLLGPALFLLFCQKSQFVSKSALHALVFHVWTIIASLAIVILAFVTFGLALLFLIPLAILEFVVPIIGAVRAAKGSVYAPPFSRNWLKA